MITKTKQKKNKPKQVKFLILLTPTGLSACNLCYALKHSCLWDVYISTMLIYRRCHPCHALRVLQCTSVLLYWSP